MAFRIPTFNVLCNVWHWETYELPSPDDGQPGQALLVEPDLVEQECCVLTNRVGPILGVHFILGFPKGTDVRIQESAIAGESANAFSDVIEFPAGSGNLWGAYGCAFPGQGYANEYLQIGVYAIKLRNPFTLDPIEPGAGPEASGDPSFSASLAASGSCSSSGGSHAATGEATFDLQFLSGGDASSHA